MEPLMPFKYVIISPEDTSMKEGCIISEFNQCGLFLCQKGQAEILLGVNYSCVFMIRLFINKIPDYKTLQYSYPDFVPDKE